MRIAYISLHWARTLSSGVGKKIDRHINTWKSMGHEARFFMHSEDKSESNLLSGEKFFYPSQSGIVKREIGRIRAAQKMLLAIERYQPDIIYLRYGMYIYPLHRLATIAPVVEEINTDDVEQHKELGFIYSSYNRLTRGLLLRRVSGLSSVSKELAKSPVFEKYKKNTKVIANGIDIFKYTPLQAPNNTTPRIVFIGTSGYVWHGIDKIITFARMFSDLEFDIIGYDDLHKYAPLPENLTMHGYLERDKYLEIFSKADLSISSLGLYRKELREASPLKSREYLAYGLPMILAYKDTDLDDLDVDFLLKIPNTENNMLTHGRLIRDFAYKMRGRRVDRDVIAPRIDTQNKEKRRLAFLEEILEQAK